MIKIQCDNCGDRIGCIIETEVFICTKCLFGKTEREIEVMLSDIKGIEVPRFNYLEVIQYEE